MDTPTEIVEKRNKKYSLSLKADQLRHQIRLAQVTATVDGEQCLTKLLNNLAEVQGELFQVDQEIAELRKQEEAGLLSKTIKSEGKGTGFTVEEMEHSGLPQEQYDVDRITRGAATTGLSATVSVKMPQVPTGYYHLLDPEKQPLLVCKIENYGKTTRRVRVSSYIEGYTARAVSTLEIDAGPSKDVLHSPIFFPGPLRDIREVTRASLNVLIEDLDNGQIEGHVTMPVWLLARNSAPLPDSIPGNGELPPYVEFLGAFVTPHNQSVMQFLHQVTTFMRDLRGYNSSATAQAKAIYQALADKRQIAYVDSVLDFTPEGGMSTQRVRLPRETLRQRQANCLDGALLFASLLEAIGIYAALVIVPGHALVGWRTDPNRADLWEYLDTTIIGHECFESACKVAKVFADTYRSQQEKANCSEAQGNKQPPYFLRLELQDLRRNRIMPLE